MGIILADNNDEVMRSNEHDVSSLDHRNALSRKWNEESVKKCT